MNLLEIFYQRYLRRGGRIKIWAIIFSGLFVFNIFSQTLQLPPRATNALSGSNFVALITPMSLTNRENTIYAQFAQGNVPNFLRQLVPISVSFATNGVMHLATYFVTADYLAIGSDADYFLEPMTPILAQKIAALVHCRLPTRKMVNQIWTNAAVKLSPSPIPPSPEMITVPVFAQHNTTVRLQRNQQLAAHPLGALVSGDKKDVIVSNRIYTNFANANITKPVVIYGWHYTNGAPIQPLYNGHGETYADYSHGIRLAQTLLTVDGISKSILQVLRDPNLAGLLSDEGIIAVANYPMASNSIRFDSTTISNRQFQCNFSGAFDDYYSLEASTDLITWTTLSALITSNFTDIEATNLRQRFYRARLNP